MAMEVAIYDYDLDETINVTERVQSVSIKETIDGAATIDVAVINLSETHAMSDIAVTYGGDTIFVGVIEDQTDELRGGAQLYRFSTWKGTDRSLKLQNRVVNRIYENKKAADIITDIFFRYPCGITLATNVANTPLIERVDFMYTPLIDCVQQLADITGYRWYVDEDSALHFFQTDEGTGATVFSTTTDGGLARNIRKDTINLTTEINDKTANRVWVIGAQTSSPQYIDQYWTGDGRNDIYSTAFTPNYPEVYEDGVKKTVEVDKGTPSDKDYVYGKKDKYLKRVAGPLPSGVQLHFKYRPLTQVIDYFEDAASIRKYGIYEKAVKDKQITEKMAARARGRAELKRRSSKIRTLSFETLDHNVKRGLKYRVVIPDLDVDSYWLCKSVTTTVSAPDTVNVTKTVEFEEVTS
ncbi:hypothetical protein EV294_11263 [Paenibacillus sp. BK033]|uniref:hypothetical protein n=1 Tax=Paenibacillus sp. BK033 TaxID=2512133 RepID=UPI001052F11D|nr:hypothetical protein [Paenibacillus sp. BK033]TCM89598.1 hypothetical protein EV294_11263 [Paenibacillus sp. BK033]